VETWTRYLTVYFVSREYGGPEEGGWYYEQRVKYASFYVGEMSATAFADLRDSLEVWTEFMNQDAPPLYSVASEGLYRVYVEQREGEGEVLHAPRYE